MRKNGRNGWRLLARVSVDFGEIIWEDFIESAIGACIIDECLFEISYLLVEYIIVGCVFVCFVNHGLDCGIFVSLGEFTVEV